MVVPVSGRSSVTVITVSRLLLVSVHPLGNPDAENYEGIYFLSDEEVLDAASRYRRWWETRKYPRTMWTIDPCYDEPLCGSGYMWW